MPKYRRSPLAIEADHRNQEQVVRLGRELRTSRKRRRITQQQASLRVGIARSTWSAAECGHGAGLTLDTWQRMALAVGRPLRLELARDTLEELADIGHLPIQELILRLGGRRATRDRSSWQRSRQIRGAPRTSGCGMTDVGC